MRKNTGGRTRGGWKRRKKRRRRRRMRRAEPVLLGAWASHDIHSAQEL